MRFPDPVLAFVVGEKNLPYAPARGGAQWNNEGLTA